MYKPLRTLRPPAFSLHDAARWMTVLIACWGSILVLAQIKPFWMDEWRLLYNLKFRPAAALFRPLDFTQQFPRVHLVLLKCFAAPFDYSYFTLRFPAFITGMLSLLLAWRLMRSVFPEERRERYLFVLLLLSAPAFLHYLVQIKQYQMDLFLSLVAVWQLMQLQKITTGGHLSRERCLLLCSSFFFAPFFSYTYPIAVAPLYGLMILRKPLRTWSMRSAWPLLAGLAGIWTGYRLDIQYVLRDAGMSCYWEPRMNQGWQPASFLNLAGMFGSTGSGDLFRAVFSVLGIMAFLFACLRIRKLWRTATAEALVVLYAVGLIVVVLALYLLHKLPLGEPRLNIFCLPSLQFLMIYLLGNSRALTRSGRAHRLLACGLCLISCGTIANTVVRTFTGNDYYKAVEIYSNTEDAIIYAQAHGIPLVVSPDIAYPDDIVHDIPCLSSIDAASVLKTFPAYKERYLLPVYTVGSGQQPRSRPLQATRSYLIGDGTNYRLINRE